MSYFIVLLHCNTVVDILPFDDEQMQLKQFNMFSNLSLHKRMLRATAHEGKYYDSVQMLDKAL